MEVLCRPIRLAFAALILTPLLACQSTGAAVTDSDAAGEDLASSSDQADPAEPATDAVKDEGEAAKGERFNLGPLQDEDLKDVAYDVLQKTLTSPRALGPGQEELTELGERSSFTFNIVKLLHGKDDISGEGGVADGMDVEVTGWYKRTLRQDADQPDPACTSFDALVAISKQGDAWHLTPGETPTFGREDREDCF